MPTSLVFTKCSSPPTIIFLHGLIRRSEVSLRPPSAGLMGLSTLVSLSILPPRIVNPRKRFRPMKRMKIKQRKAKKVFTRQASRPHPKNSAVLSRGGVRL